MQSINPATGEVLETFQEMTTSEIDRILEATYMTFRDWRSRPFADRAKLMREAARILRAGREKYAQTMALEMGKPIVQGEAEVEKCAWACDYYAEHAEPFLADQPRETDASRSYIRFEPIVPRCALQIGEVFRKAGFPEDLFRVALVGAEMVPGIIADQHIRAVTLTGSDGAGSKVAEQAGRQLKKTVLELGGSDPFIVLEDADLQKAAKKAAEARLINSGQSCIAAKRFIVVEKVADRFLALLVSQMRSRRMGNPLDHDTQVGPQARHDLRASLHRQVEESVKRGAKVLLGGRVPDGPGAFYPPTVLAAVDRGMPAFDEETFGPVAAVIRARDEAHAIRLANDSAFGLGASLWTQDPQRAERLVSQIEAGCVFVNELVKSDPRLPFGGVKRSGYGRELSEYGIREFMNIKSVWMA